MVRKSWNRTLRVTVRPASPCRRSRRADGVGHAHQLGLQRVVPVMVAGERLLVADRLGLLVGHDAAGGRWRGRARGGAGPTPARACPPPPRGAAPPGRRPCCTPRRSSRASVAGPTPHSAWTGSGCRKASSLARRRPRPPRRRPAGPRATARGLAASDASLARNFMAATPTEQVRPSRRCTSARIWRAIASTGAVQPTGAGHVEERLVERDAARPAACRTGRSSMTLALTSA